MPRKMPRSRDHSGESHEAGLRPRSEVVWPAGQESEPRLTGVVAGQVGNDPNAESANEAEQYEPAKSEGPSDASALPLRFLPP